VVGRAHEGQGAEAIHQGAASSPFALDRSLARFAHAHHCLPREFQVDFSKWCEEDDKEYTGEVAMGGGFDDMGGMGGMGGMDFSSMMGGMGGMGMGDAAGMPGADFDDEDDDEPLDDLEPKDLPPIGGEEDGPPPLEEVD